MNSKHFAADIFFPPVKEIGEEIAFSSVIVFQPFGGYVFPLLKVGADNQSEGGDINIMAALGAVTREFPRRRPPEEVCI